MEFLLTEIERALNAGLYYNALQSALTLPDICAALMSPNGKTKKEKYVQWYDTYAMEPGLNSLSGEDCYFLRCACLHQGQAQHEKSSHTKIIFQQPGNKNLQLHYVLIADALYIDLVLFCKNVVSAVRKWEPKVRDNPVYAANYPNLLQLRPKGLPPYISGIPVIA